MTLDLDELIAGWDCPAGEMRARLVVGRDGEELAQLRVDLGVMQMVLHGRPDGQRYRGLPGAWEYVRHELRVGGGEVGSTDWREVSRELQQLNYRRLALGALMEDRLRADDRAGAARFARGALEDIEACLERLRLLREHQQDASGSATLEPTLVFERTRLRVQLLVIESQYEEAVEQAEAGAGELDELLAGLGYDEELCDRDPQVGYLRDLARQLRVEYGVTQTLREQLEAAIEHEDFERAAELRDLISRRADGPRG